MGDSKWRKGGKRKWGGDKSHRPPIVNRTTVMSNVCGSGKRRYPSKPRAMHAIEKINSRNGGVMLTDAYPCQGGKDYASCEGWHTTSMKRRPAPKGAAGEEVRKHNFLSDS